MPLELERPEKRVKQSVFAASACILFFIALGAQYFSLPFELNQIHGDTKVFESIAERSIVSSKFWFSVRPPMTSLLLKISGSNENFCYLQILLSTFSWLVLAFILYKILNIKNQKIKSVIAFLTFSLSLTASINRWGAFVLSESIALSSFILTLSISIWIHHLLRQNRIIKNRWLLFWCFSATIHALSRDTNIITLAGCSAIVIGALLYRNSAVKKISIKTLKPIIAVSAYSIFLIIVVLTLHTSSKRWATPLVNNLLMRVVTQPAIYAEWQDVFGLPDSNILKQNAGKLSWQKGVQGISIRKSLEPELKAWVNSAQGKSAVLKYHILRYPSETLVKSIKFAALRVSLAYSQDPLNFSHALGSTLKIDRTLYPETDKKNKLSHWLEQKLSSLSLYSCGRFIFTTTILFIFIQLKRRSNSLSTLDIASFVLLALGFGISFLSYHGDAAALSRHSVILLPCFWLSVWFFVLSFFTKRAKVTAQDT